MREAVLRKLYAALFWLADTCGTAAGSDITIGFYRQFRRPEDVPAEELGAEVWRLAKKIEGAS